MYEMGLGEPNFLWNILYILISFFDRLKS